MDSADRRASARRAGTRLADLSETSMARFAFLLAGCVLAAAPFLDLSPELQTLLTRELSFSADDLSDLARGKVVHHSLKTVTVGEVAAVGAIRIEAPKEHFIRAYRDITRFKQGSGVLQIGRFSDPPAPADLAALTIEREDADLRNCRVGDCDIRLPAEAIARFQRDIDWTARDVGARVAALFKEVLFEAVRDYVSGGPGRIVEYDDGKRPIRPAEDFAGVLQNSPYIARLVPKLPDHLRTFPAAPLPAAKDFIYWSKEKFGFAPFISVTHVTMTLDSAGNDVMTSKDVYSSRYFDASLTMTVASSAVDDPGTFYLVYVNRSRANALKGMFGGIRRAMVEHRAKSTLADNLREIKLRLEKRP